MEYSDKRNLFLAGGAVLIVAAISYYFYKQGTKQTTQAQLPPNDNPKDPVTNTPSGASISELVSIAAELHDEMNGLNLTGHNVGPYQKAVNLSDYDFTKMYNIFNTKYQTESGQTLTEWFNSETFIFIGSTEGSIYKAFLDKLNKLNLK